MTNEMRAMCQLNPGVLCWYKGMVPLDVKVSWLCWPDHLCFSVRILGPITICSQSPRDHGDAGQERHTVPPELLRASHGGIPHGQLHKPALLNVGEEVSSKLRTGTRTSRKQPRVKVQHDCLAVGEGRKGEWS